MSSKSKKDNKSGFPLKGIIISSSLCSILFFAFVAIFSALILKKGFAASMFMPVGLLLGGVSSLLNGFVTVFPIKEKGMIYGAISGLIQALICAVVLFAVNGGAVGKGTFILMAIMIVCSALGGIGAVNFKIKKKY